MAKEIQCAFGVDIDAVAGWLGSYGGEDSPSDIQRGVFAGEIGTPRLLKLLYGVHLLIGLIADVWFVFSGFQTSTSNGLVALILGVPAMLLWIVYCRIVVELLAAVFRAAQVITNSQG